MVSFFIQMPESAFISYLLLYKPLGYLLIFLGMVVEGEAVFFIAAFLAHQGYFDFGDMALVLIGGAFTGDILWYELGRRIRNSGSSFSKWIYRVTDPFDEHILSRPMRTIFISKFLYGLNRATLVRAGMLHISFRAFIKSDVPALLLWLLIVGTLAYLFGASFLILKRYVRYVEVGILLGLALFFFLLKAVVRPAKKYI